MKGLRNLPKQSSPSENQVAGVQTPAKDDYVIRCVCENNTNHGTMIQCEKCDVWQHNFCVGFREDKPLPDNYFCEACVPRKFRCLCNKSTPIGKLIECTSCAQWQHVKCLPRNPRKLPRPYRCPSCAPQTFYHPTEMSDVPSFGSPISVATVAHGASFLQLEDPLMREELELDYQRARVGFVLSRVLLWKYWLWCCTKLARHALIILPTNQDDSSQARLASAEREQTALLETVLPCLARVLEWKEADTRKRMLRTTRTLTQGLKRFAWLVDSPPPAELAVTMARGAQPTSESECVPARCERVWLYCIPDATNEQTAPPPPSPPLFSLPPTQTLSSPPLYSHASVSVFTRQAFEAGECILSMTAEEWLEPLSCPGHKADDTQLQSLPAFALCRTSCQPNAVLQRAAEKLSVVAVQQLPAMTEILLRAQSLEAPPVGDAPASEPPPWFAVGMQPPACACLPSLCAAWTAFKERVRAAVCMSLLGPEPRDDSDADSPTPTSPSPGAGQKRKRAGKHQQLVSTLLSPQREQSMSREERKLALLMKTIEKLEHREVKKQKKASTDRYTARVHPERKDALHATPSLAVPSPPLDTAPSSRLPSLSLLESPPHSPNNVLITSPPLAGEATAPSSFPSVNPPSPQKPRVISRKPKAPKRSHAESGGTTIQHHTPGSPTLSRDSVHADRPVVVDSLSATPAKPTFLSFLEDRAEPSPPKKQARLESTLTRDQGDVGPLPVALGLPSPPLASSQSPPPSLSPVMAYPSSPSLSHAAVAAHKFGKKAWMKEFTEHAQDTACASVAAPIKKKLLASLSVLSSEESKQPDSTHLASTSPHGAATEFPCSPPRPLSLEPPQREVLPNTDHLDTLPQQPTISNTTASSARGGGIL